MPIRPDTHQVIPQPAMYHVVAATFMALATPLAASGNHSGNQKSGDSISISNSAEIEIREIRGQYIYFPIEHQLIDILGKSGDSISISPSNTS
ncbi:hypothetical protein [Candidatus Magnetaquicoccus inordinatus]|uniref:hypothetical protein n=1 Tax=Candidatus Magnetaquicoccus inordinatus TaxID=2496818 RepID=UPI00102AD88C|nr:hypothetical protein [Candidatus Magnetaquicoccus inordinatus]